MTCLRTGSPRSALSPTRNSPASPPCWRLAACLSISEGMVWGQPPGDQAPRRLCAAEPANLLILRAIDGRTALGAVAEQVQHETQLSERSFAYVRALFLRLVLAHVATPVQGAEWAV